MPNTPIFAFPYPALTDAPNGAAQIQALAEAVETELNNTNADVATVQTVTNKFATGVAVLNTQSTSGTTTSATYVETLTGGTACSTTFVAPASGKVMVHNSAFVDNNATGRSVCSWIIRNGGVVGSGTTFLDGGDSRSLSCLGADDVAATHTSLVTGLIAGSTYNIRQQFKTSAGTTGTFQFKELAVLPVWV